MQFQVPQDEAHYADFLKSPLGEKLDKPPKGAWVKVP
jgi:hypothetical protein